MRYPSQMLISLAITFGCGGESPPLVTDRPPTTLNGGFVRTSELAAGPAQVPSVVRNPYEGQANALLDGKHYYGWFNCAGCHGGAGGGGIGPPLADQDWIYGGEPAQIFQTIVQGRPNGMPSFGAQIPADQVWKIVAYVTSLAGEPGGSESGSGESRAQEGRTIGAEQ